LPAYRILSIDGGGIRGVFAAALLERVAGADAGSLDRIDLCSGTSTGGLIALGLADGMDPEAIVSLFAENGRKIFSARFLKSLRDLNGFVGAEYRHHYLRDLLEATFGDRTLADIPRRVLIPAFALDSGSSNGRPRSWVPRIFHNLEGSDTAGERIVDVALRTSAAPMYFPTYQGHIDGGVIANNPSLVALTSVRAHEPSRSLDEFRLLSVGTALVPSFIDGDRAWGVRQWLRPLLRLMVEGNMGLVHSQCEALLGERYHRLDPVPPVHVKIDQPKRMDELVEFARDAELNGTVDWLRRHF